MRFGLFFLQFITQYFELAVVKLKSIINYLAHSFLLPIKNRQLPTYTGREKQRLRDTEQRYTYAETGQIHQRMVLLLVGNHEPMQRFYKT